MKEYCGNPGRGSHRLAMASAEQIYACREALAALFDCADPGRVIFTMNTTMALNTVIKGYLKEGDHVLISDLEHNAVLRPLHRLASEGWIAYDVYPTHARREVPCAEHLLSEIQKRIRPNTRMLIATHASNVVSAILPIQEIGAFCREKGICFVVDGAQSAGHVPISLRKMNIDALCIPGHKGLWGPQGCGALLLSDGIELCPWMEGGSGVYSLEATMPTAYPERMEAGTLPTPAVVGWLEGIRAVRDIGVPVIAAHEQRLTAQLERRMESIPRIQRLAPHLHGSILLFYAKDFPSDALGRAFDQRGICVRTGFHCAALAHRTLGTPRGGAVRVSPGYFNTEEEINRFADALQEIVLS